MYFIYKNLYVSNTFGIKKMKSEEFNKVHILIFSTINL